jgi:hypothetical protein
VQVARLSDGSRKMTSFTEVIGMEGDTVTLQELFRFEQTGVDQRGNVQAHSGPPASGPNSRTSSRPAATSLTPSSLRPWARSGVGAMQDWVIVAVVFASVFSLLWGLRSLLVPKVEEPSEAMKRRLKEIANAGGPSLQEISAQAYMRHEELSSIRFLDRVLAGLPRLHHLRDLLNKAGRPMNLGTLVLLRGSLAMAGRGAWGWPLS